MCYAGQRRRGEHVTVTAAHIDKSSLVALCGRREDVRCALLRRAKRSESAGAEASCMKEIGNALEIFAALVASNVAFLSSRASTARGAAWRPNPSTRGRSSR